MCSLAATMFDKHILMFALITFLSFLELARAVTAPSVVGKPRFLGSLTAPGFPDFRCDGGSGGYVNGYHLVALSDPCVGKNCTIPSVHTAYAYFGIANATDPTEITIIADYETGEFHRVGSGGVIVAAQSDAVHGSNFAPGPFGRMIAIDEFNSTAGLNVWTVYDAGKPLYNTMIEFDVRNPTELNHANQNFPAQRTVLELFQAEEAQYGSAGLLQHNGYLHLFAVDNVGIKMARVETSERTDRSKYQYFDGEAGTYGNEPFKHNSTEGNFHKLDPNSIFGFDIFYNHHYENFLMTFDNGGFTDLSVLYSKTGNLEGPYIQGAALNMTLDPKAEPGPVYLGHAHPDWDHTGKTLLYSWSSNNEYLNFGLATFQ